MQQKTTAVNRQVRQQAPQSLLDLLKLILKGMLKGWLLKLIFAGGIAFITWVLHTYLLVGPNGGFAPGENPILDQILALRGRAISGTLFWTLLSLLISLTLTSLFRRGIGKTFSLLLTTPSWVLQAFRKSGQAAAIIIAIFFVGGMLFGRIQANPLNNLQMTILLLGSVIAQQESFAGLVTSLAWSDAQRLLKPKKPRPFRIEWVPPGLLGASFGILLATLLGSIPPLLSTLCTCFSILMVIGSIIAVVLLKKQKTTPANLLILIGILFCLLLLATPALADDGGWQEAGGNLGSWIQSEGAMIAILMGFPPALGASFGTLLGSLLGGLSIPIPITQLPSMPGEITLTDAAGKTHTYVWSDEHQGYVNVLTGGVLDETLWEEYNRNLLDNQRFIEEQREKLSTRDTEFDRQMDTLVKTQKEKEAYTQQMTSILNDLKEKASKIGVYGEPAVNRLNNLLQAVRNGEKVPLDRLQAIDRYISSHLAGKTIAEGDKVEYSTWGALKDAVVAFPRTLFTGKNIDGSTNYASVGVRIGFAVGTLGKSEFVYTPVDAAYTFKDCLSNGQSVTSAVGTTPLQVGLGIGIGKASGVVFKGVGYVGGKIAGATGRYISKTFPGFSKTVTQTGKAFIDWGKEATKSVQDGWKSLNSRVSKAFTNQGIKAPLSQTDKVLRDKVSQALKSGDKKQVLDLYKKGGMKKLGKLEQGGHLTSQEAKQINDVMTIEVNVAVQNGTQKAVDSFEQKTGVKVKEVLVGDSGSSAKGGVRSVVTDNDRTVLSNFDKASLQEYAQKNGLSLSEAQQQLSKELADSVENQVSKELADTLGATADDVDFKVYNGIGSSAGPSDSYPMGFTKARQAISGKTTVFRPGKTPYTVSGEALTDAHALQQAQFTGQMPADPLRIPNNELKGLLSQQVKSANSHSDVKSLAKAFTRSDYVAQRSGAQLDPTLREISRQISKNPQEMNSILQNSGMTAEEYVNSCKDVINRFANSIGE
ncbi:MAG: hypothetical protein N3D16_04470 [Anaerolineales bacterium]|nr:hypothetical protein [Anaerolineales bacterium]